MKESVLPLNERICRCRVNTCFILVRHLEPSNGYILKHLISNYVVQATLLTRRTGITRFQGQNELGGRKVELQWKI